MNKENDGFRERVILGSPIDGTIEYATVYATTGHKLFTVGTPLPEGSYSEQIKDDSLLREILKQTKRLHDRFDEKHEQLSQRHNPCMSTHQAADYLGMTPRGVRVAAEQGRLLGHKNPMSKSRGNRWRFKKAELDKHMQTPKSEPPREDISIYANEWTEIH
jgi:excisionase family DNA binding protein